MTAATKTAGSIPNTTMAAWYNTSRIPTKRVRRRTPPEKFYSFQGGTGYRGKLYDRYRFSAHQFYAAYIVNATTQIVASDSTSMEIPITCTQSIPAMDERCRGQVDED